MTDVHARANLDSVPLVLAQANDFYELPLSDDQGSISRFLTVAAPGAGLGHCIQGWSRKLHMHGRSASVFSHNISWNPSENALVLRGMSCLAAILQAMSFRNVWVFQTMSVRKVWAPRERCGISRGRLRGGRAGSSGGEAKEERAPAAKHHADVQARGRRRRLGAAASAGAAAPSRGMRGSGV